jgi:hemoglobin-like flavoprotein
MMNPEDAALVRHTWALILPQRKQVCRSFYERLFARHPELRPLFKGDIDHQADLFVTMINTVISALDDPRPVRPLIETLGARHVDYGVAAGDYDKFEQVLLETLAEALGDEATPEVQAAWQAVFEELSAVMRAGAERG